MPRHKTLHFYTYLPSHPKFPSWGSNLLYMWHQNQHKSYWKQQINEINEILYFSTSCNVLAWRHKLVQGTWFAYNFEYNTMVMNVLIEINVPCENSGICTEGNNTYVCKCSCDLSMECETRGKK